MWEVKGQLLRVSSPFPRPAVATGTWFQDHTEDPCLYTCHQTTAGITIEGLKKKKKSQSFRPTPFAQKVPLLFTSGPFHLRVKPAGNLPPRCCCMQEQWLRTRLHLSLFWLAIRRESTPKGRKGGWGEITVDPWTAWGLGHWLPCAVENQCVTFHSPKTSLLIAYCWLGSLNTNK